ncbi:hypothetical protein RB195_020366 [Necator americanus]|uniref:Endonuclease/exonuclease/phosphatase domain-containing protein n=1 Tax=Necator americanus TaxID=51031 RepID=A0ABR1CJW4_NECAM
MLPRRASVLRGNSGDGDSFVTHRFHVPKLSRLRANYGGGKFAPLTRQLVSTQSKCILPHGSMNTPSSAYTRIMSQQSGPRSRLVAEVAPSRASCSSTTVRIPVLKTQPSGRYLLRIPKSESDPEDVERLHNDNQNIYSLPHRKQVMIPTVPPSMSMGGEFPEDQYELVYESNCASPLDCVPECDNGYCRADEKKRFLGLTADQKRPCACPETQVDSGDGLPASAVPGLTRKIIVSRTSVRPKACNQLTGRCKGGGLESPPTNKLHMSTLGERKFSQKPMGLEACNLPVGFKFHAKNSNRKESPDSGRKPGTVAPGRTGLQESCRLPKRKRTRMTICTYNARTLASEAAIEDLMVQAKKIKYDVIGLTETRRRHSLNAVFETGEELFLGTCDSRGVGGVGVLVNTSMAQNIDSFEQLTTRIGRLRMRRCGPTPALTIFVAYAPTSSYEEEEVEAFYMDLEKFYREDHAFYKVIIGDFNAKVGPRRTPEELHIGTHGLQWNDQGERLSEFIMTTKTIHGNSQFQKPSSLRWTWESPGGGYRNEIDHIIVNKRFCLTDVAVVPKFYTGSDHRLLRGRFSFTRRAEKAAKFSKRNPRTTINWDLFATLAGFWEDSAMDNIDEEYDRLVKHLHDCAKKAESIKTTKRRLSLETLELIRQRGAARAAGNQELTSELARLCREAIKKDFKGEQKCWLKQQRREKASAMPAETSPVARQG